MLLGTAWSTDKMRKGSYNLYYCLADSITGPYGPRRFVGRFFGLGTTIVPLQVKVREDGDVFIRAKDPADANPGPEEAQDFEKVDVD